MTDNSQQGPQRPRRLPQQPGQQQQGQPYAGAQQGQPQQGQPYAGPQQPPPGYAPAPPYANQQQGQGFAAPQQPNPYAPQQFQPPYGGPPQGQPYGGPVAPAAGAGPSKLIGWLLVLLGVIAIGSTFAPWAKVSLSGSAQGIPISVNMSANAYNHSSCSASAMAKSACDSSGNSSTSSSTSSPGGTPDKRSMWEGWAVAPIGALLIVIGVLRGIGQRGLDLPGAVAAIVGGAAVVAMVVVRWSWIVDQSDKMHQAISAAPEMKGFDAGLSAGWGLWLALVVGVLALLAGVGGLVKRQ